MRPDGAADANLVAEGHQIVEFHCGRIAARAR
jgi:hypothetical protein